MTNLQVPAIILTLVLVFCNHSDGFGQSRKRLRELEKMEQSHEAEEDTNNEEGKKRHESIQSKQTRKEMKRYLKLNKNYNNNRRTFSSRIKSRKRK
jgi:hypothetical protein